MIKNKVSKRSSVLFLIPTLGGGGAERIFVSLWEHIKCNNKIVAVYNKREQFYKIDDCLELDKIHGQGYLSWFLNYFIRLLRLYELKKKRGVRVSISFLNNASLLNIITSRGEKIILSIHTIPSKVLGKHTFYGILYSILIKLFFNKADKITVVSKGVKEDLIRNFNIKEKKIMVINNPYDLKAIYRLSKERLKRGEEKIFRHKVIINIGRMEEVKGQWHLIKAFKYARESFGIDAKLIFLGEGTLLPLLRDLVKNLGIEEDVYFLGRKKNPFIYLSRASIFVFSSHYEGFPNALVESLICGTPVISTDCYSGPREILAPNTNFKNKTKTIEYGKFGVLIPECQNSSVFSPISSEERIMGEAINILLKDARLREYYKIVGKKRGKDFDLDTIINEYEKVIFSE